MAKSYTSVDNLWDRGSQQQSTIVQSTGNTTSGSSNAIGSLASGTQLQGNFSWLNPLGNEPLTVTSPYGKRTYYSETWHHGVDVRAYLLPVYAMQDGTVRTATYGGGKGGRGYYIKVETANGGAYLVQHLSKMFVSVGDKVKQGDKIAISGNSGVAGDGGSYAYHLHFECHKTYPTTYVKTCATTDYNPMNNTYYGLNGNKIYAGSASSGSSGSSGSGSGSGNTGDGDGTYSGESTDSNGTPQVVVIHTPETKQWYTVYPSDDKSKLVDAYEIVIEKWDTKKSYDISDICTDVSLTDATTDTATQFHATVIQNNLDKYIKFLDIQTGDKISLRNTANNDVVFSGSILTISVTQTGLTTIDALDDGRLLTTNEVIARFENQPVYDVICSIAYKCGVKKISCPAFESTFSATVKGTGSQIINEVLEQATEENGVNYFVRVLGDTIVVKSYSNTAMIPYWRSAPNIAVTECLRDASEWQTSTDATGVRSSVQVIQTSNGGCNILASATDKETEQRYGKLNGNYDYNSVSNIAAESTALYYLKYVASKPTETFSISCPASDRLIAGARIAIEIDGEYTEYWVLSAVHSYIPQHTVKLTLQKCEEALTTEALRALYTVTEESTLNDTNSDTADSEAEDESTEEDAGDDDA